MTAAMAMDATEAVEKQAGIIIKACAMH